MAKMLVIDTKTRIIKNVVDAADKYDPPHGRELVKGTGKPGEVYKEPAKKARKDKEHDKS